MNSIRIYIISASLFLSVLLGCSSKIPFLKDIPSCCLISPPDVHLTGEKTVVERQIVGDYRELEKDAWIISSVRTNIQRSKGTTTGGDEYILKALKIREFHEDKIRRYKDQGAVGEKNNGFIAYIRHSKYESDKNLKNILLRVAEEENKARKIAIPDEGLILEPGKLYLGRTVEYTNTDKYVPMIEGRSSIGRL